MAISVWSFLVSFLAAVSWVSSDRTSCASFSYMARSCARRCSKLFFWALAWPSSVCAPFRWFCTSWTCLVSDPIWFDRLASSVVSLLRDLLTSGSGSPRRSSSKGVAAGAADFAGPGAEALEPPVPWLVRPRPKEDDGTNGLNVLAWGDGLAGDDGPAGLIPLENGS